MTAPPWSDGYVADIPYITNFYPDQAPAHLDFSCVLNGLEPARLGRAFTYCELGCGQGLTSALLAAANPEGSFYAVDFNPGHVATGQSLAFEAGLDNIKLIEASFEELNGSAARELPDLDYVTLHGVYTWISVDNRRAIVEFIRRRLKPGGAVYISYNCMPQWAAALPLQRLIYDFAALAPGGSEQRLGRAFSAIKELRQATEHRFPGDSAFDWIFEAWESGRATYLSHELLAADWQPLYHADVARDLAEAKLSFAASSRILENLPDLAFSPEQQAFLARVEDSELRETIKDFLRPRLLRRDIFVRGARRLSAARREALLRSQRLAIALPRRRVELTIDVPKGQIALKPQYYEPTFDALAERPRTLGELLELSGSELQATELAALLVGSGQAFPAAAPSRDSVVESCRRFNAAVAQRAMHDPLGNEQFFAAGLVGTGLRARGLEAHIYRALEQNRPLDAGEIAGSIWAILATRGETIISEGRRLEDKEECLAFLREQAQRVIDEDVPLWRSLEAL